MENKKNYWTISTVFCPFFQYRSKSGFLRVFYVTGCLEEVVIIFFRATFREDEAVTPIIFIGDIMRSTKVSEIYPYRGNKEYDNY